MSSYDHSFSYIGHQWFDNQPSSIAELWKIVSEDNLLSYSRWGCHKAKKNFMNLTLYNMNVSVCTTYQN